MSKTIHKYAELKVHDVSVSDRARVGRFIFRNSAFLTLPRSGLHPLAKEAISNPELISRDLRDLLVELGSNRPCDAVILRSAVSEPRGLRFAARRRIIEQLDKDDWSKTRASYWVRSAMNQLIARMGAAGYIPLLHSYECGELHYIFRARAVEDLGERPGYPHKLPARAATVLPNLPFGPSLNGPEAAQFDGTYSPDVVAYIMLETPPQPRHRNGLGPRLFFLDQVLLRLGEKNRAAVELLQQNIYAILPDSHMGRIRPTPGHSNPFGAIQAIGLFGGKGVDGPTYMRLAMGRHQASLGVGQQRDAESGAHNLDTILDGMRNSDVAPRLNLQRGDVLLVNNRRTATAWEAECAINNWFGGRRDEHVKSGDRVVFQMHFYYPRNAALDELVTRGAAPTGGAANDDGGGGDSRKRG